MCFRSLTDASKLRAVLWNLPIEEITTVQKLGFALIKIAPIAEFDKIFEVGLGKNSICLDKCSCLAVAIPSTKDRFLLRPYKLIE